MQFKYVIFEGDKRENGSVTDERHAIAFLFPGIIVHADFARFRRHTHIQMDEIVSAGFVDIGLDGKPYCHGRSESLKLNSRGAIDEEIIKRSNQYFYSTLKVDSGVHLQEGNS